MKQQTDVPNEKSAVLQHTPASAEQPSLPQLRGCICWGHFQHCYTKIHTLWGILDGKGENLNGVQKMLSQKETFTDFKA